MFQALPLGPCPAAGVTALSGGQVPSHSQTGPRLAKNVPLSLFTMLMPPLGTPASPPPSAWPLGGQGVCRLCLPGKRWVLSTGQPEWPPGGGAQAPGSLGAGLAESVPPRNPLQLLPSLKETWLCLLYGNFEAKREMPWLGGGGVWG